jgi:8-oxo-dGTP diphosphatase
MEQPNYLVSDGVSKEAGQNADTPEPFTMDWGKWKARENAVLCFVTDRERVLLIHKKRGLGKGKINGPGGRTEPGESFQDAAVRETIEEIGVKPVSLRDVGSLSFQFTDGYSLYARVFIATGYTGIPISTDEADPFWCDKDDIPFDQMWADDVLWLPHVLDGGCMDGRFVFSEDRMLYAEIDYRQ